jgi:uncharacterized protein (TIGR03086 family)
VDVTELVSHDCRALDVAVSYVAEVAEGDLGRPTPCAGWTLGDLLQHMVANNNGWVRAAAGLPGERPVWEEASLGDDPAAVFADSARRVAVAFADPDLEQRFFDVYDYGVFPARIALGMHLVDFVVHGWDVARAMADPRPLDEDVCQIALDIALRWPKQRPNKAFDVIVPISDDASAADRLVAYLGRSPSWTAP